MAGKPSFRSVNQPVDQRYRRSVLIAPYSLAKASATDDADRNFMAYGWILRDAERKRDEDDANVVSSIELFRIRSFDCLNINRINDE